MIEWIISELQKGFFGFVGGGLFFLSWAWQLYISNKARQSKVDIWFWLIRLLGMSFLTIHVVLRKDLPLSLMNGVGMLICLYNILLFIGGKNEEVLHKM